MDKVSAILFRFQFCGSRPDKIMNPDVQYSDGSHDRLSGNRYHKDYESDNNHLHSLCSGGQPPSDTTELLPAGRIRQRIGDDGREADQESHVPLDDRSGYNRWKHYDLCDQLN